MERGPAGNVAVITGAGAGHRARHRTGLRPAMVSQGAGYMVNMASSASEGLDHFATAMRYLALGRVNAPEDVAAVILFLAYDGTR
jgi:hypothetical protein